jgi:hypothetical protein
VTTSTGSYSIALRVARYGLLSDDDLADGGVLLEA